MLKTSFPSLLTKHAQERAQQRGMPAAALDLVYRCGDVDLPAGGGCTRRAISHRAAAELLAEGESPALVERAARLILVIGNDGMVLTAWPKRSAARKAPYMHAHRSGTRR